MFKYVKRYDCQFLPLKMKKIKRAKKRKKFLALLNVGASLHLCKQLNFLSFICSNKTVTENPCGPKKLNSDVPSYIWTLEPCRLDCSSRKVKRSGYLLDFIFGRHAKLSQCFFPWGGITYDGKSLHTK